MMMRWRAECCSQEALCRSSLCRINADGSTARHTITQPVATTRPISRAPRHAPPNVTSPARNASLELSWLVSMITMPARTSVTQATIRPERRLSVPLAAMTAGHRNSVTGAMLRVRSSGEMDAIFEPDQTKYSAWGRSPGHISSRL